EHLARLEGTVEHGAGEQVAHLHADQRLAAPRRGPRDLDVETVVGRVLVLEIHLPFEGDRFDQCGHPIILECIAKLRLWVPSSNSPLECSPKSACDGSRLRARAGARSRPPITVILQSPVTRRAARRAWPAACLHRRASACTRPR